MRKKIFILFTFMFISFFNVFADDTVRITYNGKSDPSISRFLDFTVIYPNTIYKASFKVFINDQNKTANIQSEEDKGVGKILVKYFPVTPYPLGKIKIRIESFTKTGEKVVNNFTLNVNPSSDKALAQYFGILHKNPRNANAHLGLAKVYEKKFLYRDAVYEYFQTLKYNPNSKEAKEKYKKLFALLERKYIVKDNISVDVTKNAILEKMGNLILFKTTIINKSTATIKLDPSQALLIVDEDQQLVPVTNLSKYPESAQKSGYITMENYARLSHYLDNNCFSLIQEQSISPGISIEGYIAFGLRYPQYKNITFMLPIKVGNKYSLIFKLPFTSAK